MGSPPSNSCNVRFQHPICRDRITPLCRTREDWNKAEKNSLFCNTKNLNDICCTYFNILTHPRHSLQAVPSRNIYKTLPASSILVIFSCGYSKTVQDKARLYVRSMAIMQEDNCNYHFRYLHQSPVISLLSIVSNPALCRS